MMAMAREKTRNPNSEAQDWKRLKVWEGKMVRRLQCGKVKDEMDRFSRDESCPDLTHRAGHEGNKTKMLYWASLSWDAKQISILRNF